MDKYVIEGGRPLNGSLTAMRSKNATLPILAGALLAESGTTVIDKLPELRDIDIMLRVLEHLGAKIQRDRQNQRVKIDASNLTADEAPYDLVRQMRASFLVLGSLLGRLQRARVSLPGGCSLGQRPVDLHLRGFSRLGVTIDEDSGYVVAKGQVIGNTVYFDRPSHTGTENIILAAVKGKGHTRIINAACDPEVADLAHFLNEMGAKVTGAGSSVVEVEGVEELKAVDYQPMPDRLEVGTLLCMAAVSRGSLEIRNAKPAHLQVVIQKMREMGCEVEEGEDSVSLSANRRLQATDFYTYPYPGFPTDLQACFVAVACTAAGTSRIRETVFDDRFSHCMELKRLGAKISITGDVATVEGVPELSGTTVMASDIRAGAGLVAACLGANGTSEVRRIYHIERGYESLPEKLESVGASIRKVPEV